MSLGLVLFLANKCFNIAYLVNKITLKDKSYKWNLSSVNITASNPFLVVE